MLWSVAGRWVRQTRSGLRVALGLGTGRFRHFLIVPSGRGMMVRRTVTGWTIGRAIKWTIKIDAIKSGEASNG
jgi:hypothetical protein